MYRFLLIILSVLGSSAIFAGNINPPLNISSSLYKEYDPFVSPRGRYLVHSAESDGDENIYLLDLEKRDKRRITSHTASDYSPCFIGESKILFVSRRGNSLGDIYISDLRGEKINMIIGGSGYYDTPVAARDEKRISYVHSGIDDQVFINIYNLKSQENIKGPEGILPSFFPSGDSLIYVSPAGDDNTNRLAVYSLLDSSVSYLDTPEGLNLNPVVLNDGHSILFENK